MSDRLLLFAPELDASAVQALRVAVREAQVELVAADLVTGAVREMPFELRLPRRLRRHRAKLRLVERVTPTVPDDDDARAADAADRAALMLLRRYRTGDRGAAAELFDAWFDRTAAYATVWLGNPAAAERATLVALRDVLESAAADGQRAGFRALLVSRLHAAGGAPAHDPPPARPRPLRDDGELLRNLGKLSAADLYLLLVRLPAAQRRLLGMLHLLNLTPDVAGPLLGLDDEALRGAERGALRELRLAVERFGRSGSRDLDRLASHTFGAYSPVVRSRWAALPARV
jgi:hypothetical protein